MIPLAEAQAFVLAGCPPLPPGPVPLAEASGLVLADEVRAAHAVPPFATTSMDGYAVRAADCTSAPVTLAVVGTLLAGRAPTREVGTGEAVRIMTGAPLPPGADAVCMVEQTRTDAAGASVVIEVPLAPGTAVRGAGDDIAEGQVVFEAGEVLGPGHLGVLASLGITEVTAHRRPVVGVLSTGDEVVEGPGPLPPGKIRDANRPSLLATLRGDGLVALDLGIVGDDEAAIADALAGGAATCDAVVVSGGVSVGDVDYTKTVLEQLSGGSMRWMQVAIRPAKPLAFGTLAADGTPVFGLPGNPVSALVSYELFVRPALRAMAGRADLGRPTMRATAASTIERRPDGKLHLVRVRVEIGPDGRLWVAPSGRQESHLLRAMAEANGLALLADGPGVEAGEGVEVLLLDAGELAGSRVPQGAGGPRQGVTA
ncbi:MAG TPA: gephyrin-like molybdotransferase Glp [Acidimicrobiales bacterium]|nr:gephyrin-like molybdotransferase Glp [Acidimicrobiales bacterium]